MKKKRYEQFDIIEDPDALPARKPKRKHRPVHIPWRWVILSFFGAMLLVGLVALVVFPVRVETNVVTVVPTLTGEGEYIRDIAWAGSRTAVAGANSLRVYDDLVARSQPQRMNDYGEGVARVFDALALSPDGAQVAGMSTFSSVDGQGRSEVAVWDTRSGDLLREFDAHVGGNSTSMYSGDVNSIAYSPSGTHMITGAGDGRLIVWDVVSGEEVAALDAGGKGTWGLAFRPDSDVLAAFIQYDQWNAAIQVWDISTGQQVSEIALTEHNILQVAFSQDAAYAALREWREDTGFFFSLWDIQRGAQIGTIPIDEAYLIDEVAVESNWLAVAGRQDGQTELRAIHWEESGTFQFELMDTKSDMLSQATIRHLHFENDVSGATWLNYLSGGNSDLQRWNLDTGATGSIRFW